MVDRSINDYKIQFSRLNSLSDPGQKRANSRSIFTFWKPIYRVKNKRLQIVLKTGSIICMDTNASLTMHVYGARLLLGASDDIDGDRANLPLD